MKRLLIVFGLLVVVTTLTFAQEPWGSDTWLRNGWTAYQKVHQGSHLQEDMEKINAYWGYVYGYYQALVDANILERSLVPLGEMCSVVGEYLDKHPDLSDKTAREIVYAALIEEWKK